MTYKEFKRKMELATGVSLMWKDTANYKVLCEKGVDYELFAVNKNKGYERHFKINTIYINALLNLYNDNNYDSFLKWFFELLATPIEEREREQKYYVKLNIPDTISSDEIYLNRYTNTLGSTYLILHTKGTKEHSFMNYQTQFTMEEIEEIIPKEDMDKFKFIPVEEEK